MGELNLNSIGQIHVTVDDLDGMVAFYRDVLGMEFLFDVPGQSMAFFNCDGIRLYLGKAEGLDRPSHPLIYYSVDDIASACEMIQNRGIELKESAHVVHRTEQMELWMASFLDPEDNLVCLMEERSVG